MSLLTFQCPVCDGMFRADETTTEVNCPYCQETIGLTDQSEVPSTTGRSDLPSAVEMSVTRAQSSAPLLPPSFRKPKGHSGVSEDNESRQPIARSVIHSHDQESQTPVNRLTEAVENDNVYEESEKKGDTNDKKEDDLRQAAEELAVETATQHTNGPEFMAATRIDVEELPAIESDVLIDVNDEPKIVTEVAGQETGEESLVSVESEGLLPNLPDPDRASESEVQLGVGLSAVLEQLDTAFDDEVLGSDFLPPAIDGESVDPGEKIPLPVPEIQTDEPVQPQMVESVSIKFSEQPKTVGHGNRKIELMSRTSDEKAQFKRNKNVIVWTVGALLILLTMLIMLNFS